jgi:outer membrane protein assembly factor BamA
LQYKLAGLELAPGSILTQAEFDKVSGLRRGEVVSPVKLRACWEYLRRQYRNRGYMHAEIIPEATFDRAQGTVSYSVSAAAGQVYTTGNVRVRNVSEELRDMTLAALKLKPGEPFNEGAIRGMTATHLVNPAFERIIPNYNLSYTLTLHEGVQTVDVDINLGPRHP